MVDVFNISGWEATMARGRRTLSQKLRECTRRAGGEMEVVEEK
jgi:hypothetical protein